MKKILLFVSVMLLIGGNGYAQQKKLWPTEKGKTTQVTQRQRVVNYSTHRAKSVIDTFPYLEGFENGMGNWMAIDHDSDGYNWMLLSNYSTGLSDYVHGGVDCATSQSYDNATYSPLTPDNWLISSQIQIPAGATFELSWYAKGQDQSYFSEYYSVYIATADTVEAFLATTAVYSGTTTANWTRQVVDLSAYAGRSIYIAFRHYNTNDMYLLMLDDIRIGNPGAPEISIAGPEHSFVNEPTTYIATTSPATATVRWEITGATPSTVTGNTVTVTWSTTGNYQVKAITSNTWGSDSAMINVNVISCDPVVMPWSEDFESGEGCWTFVDNNENDNNWSILENANYAYEGMAALMAYYSDTTEDDYAISPAVIIPADSTNAMLTYMVRADDAYPETYEVLISNSGRNLSSFTRIFTETYAGDYEMRSLSLSAYAGDTIYVAFRHLSQDQYFLLIDNVSIIGPRAPMAVTIHGAESAHNNTPTTFVASCGNGEGVTYAWTAEGATPATATGDTAIFSWASAGNYTVKVVATNAQGSTEDSISVEIINCDAIAQFPWKEDFENQNTLSCWSYFDEDGDQYNWSWTLMSGDTLTYGYQGSHGLLGSQSYVSSGWSGSPLTPDNWVFSPMISLPQEGPLYLSWYDKGQDPSYCAEHYAAYITNALSPDPTLTPIYEGEADSVWSHHVVDLTPYLGQDVYVVFRHYNSTDLFILLIDEIEIASHIGIAETDEAKVRLYPNPTTGMVTIDAEGLKEVQVLDLNGRTVMSQENGSTLNLNRLPNGVYVVRTITESGVSVQKIIKR